MTSMRHEILGKRLPGTVAEYLSVLAEGEAMRNTTSPNPDPKSPQQFDRVMQLNSAVMHIVLEHLGYGPIDRLKVRLEWGVDFAVDYYFGDWWKANEDDARALDKSRPDRALAWFEILPFSLLLGGLAGRWSDVSKIASWLDSTIEMEYQAGQLPDEHMQLFLCIASDLRPEPMAGVGEMLANVKQCRAKRTRLLCAAWEAAIAKDQKAFDKAFKDSVAHFVKVEAEDVPNVNFWVALEQSIVWLIAERKGLKFPALSEKLDAAVVRRQSIGLA